MFGVNPVEMAIHEAEKHLLAIDLDHDGKPDVIELKDEIEKLKAEYDQVAHIGAGIAAILHAHPEILVEIKTFLKDHFPRSAQTPIAQEALALVEKAVALQPKAAALIEKAASVAAALAPKK